MKFLPAALVCAGLSFAVSTASHASPILRSASGSDALSITAARDLFRADLGGGVVAGANGSFGGVRREINWDGVPDAFSAPANLPANFFNVNSPRGAVFSGPGTGFQVSADVGKAPVEFGNINPTFPSLFAVFSSQRLFTALGSNIVDVNLFVAGTAIPGLTTGFGAVFTDVDMLNTTSIQYFDIDGASLGTFFVAPFAGNETFSFLGVSFTEGAIVSRVRITNGNAALAAGVNETDMINLVAMDDFLFGEPKRAVPEPPTLLLLGAGLMGWLGSRLRKSGNRFFKRHVFGPTWTGSPAQGWCV